MARHRNYDWNLPENNGKPNVHDWNSVHTAMLMDIRDELQILNRLLGCANFRQVPAILRGIRANTAKPKRKKK